MILCTFKFLGFSAFGLDSTVNKLESAAPHPMGERSQKSSFSTRTAQQLAVSAAATSFTHSASFYIQFIVIPA